MTAPTDLSGIARYDYRLDGGSWTPAAGTSAALTLAESTHSFEVRAVDGAGNVGPASLVALTVDETAPAVTGFGFDVAAAAQAVSFSFSENVAASLSGGGVSFRDLTTGQAVPPAAVYEMYDSASNTATWTFPGLPQQRLSYGDRYEISFPAGGAADPAGNPLVQCVGQVGQRTWQVVAAIPGDANLDGQTDATDYLLLKENFGLACGASWGMGDFDGDLAVGPSDLLCLQEHFGQRMPVVEPAEPLALPLAAAPSQTASAAQPHAAAVRPQIEPFCSFTSRHHRMVLGVVPPDALGLPPALLWQR